MLRICGWERRNQVPRESTFSRSFAEFALTQLPVRVHASVIKNSLSEEIVGHLSRDSTEIEAREKPVKKTKVESSPKKKRGRPKKGEKRPKALPRLERQKSMTLDAMIEDLPKDCDVGSKKNSKGYKGLQVAH